MQKYKIIKKLGSGSFGNVQMAQNLDTKEIVAIKQLKKKYGTWEECLQLSEVKALRKMNHSNIIKLKEVIRVVNEAFFVFEFIERDLFKLLLSKKERGERLRLDELKHIAWQIAEALQYIHRQGFFHRDLKPENILIGTDLSVKIIDFGISKEIRCRPPFTEYIATRWYRAPELLFHFPVYTAAVDVFAFGCIIAEMVLMRPLFQGNSQIDQISRIASVLGSPEQSWPEGHRQATKRGFNLSNSAEVGLQNVLSECPPDLLNFISGCLKYDPNKRLTPTAMLAHPFLQNHQPVPEIIVPTKVEEPINTSSDKTQLQEYVDYDSKEDKQFDEILKDFTAMHLARKRKNQDQLDF